MTDHYAVNAGGQLTYDGQPMLTLVRAAWGDDAPPAATLDAITRAIPAALNALNAAADPLAAPIDVSEIVTADDLDAATAMFETRAEAQTAADAAMPRRKHNRPFPARYGRASALAGADRWIVWVGNVVLLRDGSMYDYQRGLTVWRPARER